MGLPYQQARQIYDSVIGSKNYAGSSGYWGDLGENDFAQGKSRYGLGYPGDRDKTSLAVSLGLAPTQAGATVASLWPTQGKESAYLGGDGRWYSSQTGKIFSGTDATTGKSYNNGYEQQDVNDRYKAVEVVKDQPVADEASKLLDTFKTAAASSLKDFDAHLSDFNSDLASARTKSAQATDIGGTEAALRDQQSRYNRSLDTASGDYERLNNENAEAERALVARAEGVLPEYDAAAAAIGDRQLAALNQNVSRYKLGSSTPRSMGSYENRILARNVADVFLPLEQQRIARKLDLIQNLSLPVQRELYGNERSRLTQFNPEIARQEFATGQATEQTIQGLRQTVSQMSQQDAVRFMQALGVPSQIQQQIISNQISQLGGIAQLNAESRYRGLQDLQGAYPSQSQYYNLGVPGYPNASSPTSRYGLGTGNSIPVSNAPITVSPQGRQPSADPYANLTDTQINGLTGQAADDYWSSQGAYPTGRYVNPNGSIYQPQYPRNGYYSHDVPQAGGRYNSATGHIEDADGNWIDV